MDTVSRRMDFYHALWSGTKDDRSSDELFDDLLGYLHDRGSASASLADRSDFENAVNCAEELRFRWFIASNRIEGVV